MSSFFSFYFRSLPCAVFGGGAIGMVYTCVSESTDMRRRDSVIESGLWGMAIGAFIGAGWPVFVPTALTAEACLAYRKRQSDKPKK